MTLFKKILLTFSFLWTITGCTASSNNRVKENVTSAQEPTSDAVYYSIFIWYKDASKLREFEEKATPYFQRYGLSLIRIINNVSSVEAEGTDHIKKPDEIQLAKAVDDQALGRLFEDEEFLALLSIRAEGVANMHIVEASKDQIMEFDLEAEIFGVGIFYFDGTGEKGLRKFEKKASRYFEKHNLKLASILTSKSIIPAIGDMKFPMPDEVQFLTIKDQQSLEDLFGDQGFLDLIPLRSDATKRVTFFLGSKLY